eukprot:1934834-Rhodomonas_salina.7
MSRQYNAPVSRTPSTARFRTNAPVAAYSRSIGIRPACRSPECTPPGSTISCLSTGHRVAGPYNGSVPDIAHRVPDIAYRRSAAVPRIA